MKAMKTAQAEMSSIVKERGVLEALTPNIPPAADRMCNIGGEVVEFSDQ